MAGRFSTPGSGRPGSPRHPSRTSGRVWSGRRRSPISVDGSYVHFAAEAGQAGQRDTPASLTDHVAVEPVGEVGEGEAGSRVGEGDLPAGSVVTEGARRHRTTQ